jgi:hypothetical protein
VLTPPVGRASSKQKWAVGAFSAGLLLGGLLTASLLWLLSGLGQAIAESWRTSILIATAALALLRDLDVLRFPLPQPLRQVPRFIFEKGLLSAAFQFGLELGTGVRTYITSSIPYVLALAIVLLPLPYLVAACVGLGFGLGRAVVPLLRLASGNGEAWSTRMAHGTRWLVPTSSALSLIAVLMIGTS